MATETLLFEVGMDSKEEMRAMVIEVIQFFMTEQFNKTNDPGILAQLGKIKE